MSLQKGLLKYRVVCDLGPIITIITIPFEAQEQQRFVEDKSDYE